MPITPDTKDWTWVLERPCPECGFASAAVERSQVGTLIVDNARSWQDVLRRSSGVRDRPSDDRWSVLEYGCHVRDVFGLYHRRLLLMLAEDNPTFANWDQDATALEDRYSEQDALRVADDLSHSAGELAAAFDDLTDDQWMRTGARSDGAHFTVESFARYLVHDPVHHLHDVAGATSPL
jgi:hypothetical protein